MRKTLKLLGTAVIALLLSFGFVASVSIPAKADVVYEPTNSFYLKNKSRCEQIDRIFAVNAIGGSTAVYESPKSNKEVATVLTGEEFWVELIYTSPEGVEWACINQFDGWIPMAYLTNLYDDQMFRSEHKDEIQDNDGPVDAAIAEKAGKIYFYEYPGSKEYFDLYNSSDVPYYTYTYVDPYGHEWGYVAYYYLSKGWVCLDDTGATYEDLYPDGQTFSGILPEVEEPTQVIVPSSKLSAGAKAVVGVIIGVIVLATAVVIAIMILKKKKHK